MLQNQNLEALDETANALANRIRGLTNAAGAPLLSNVRVSYEVNKPELRVHVDRNRAASLGVSLEDVSRTLQILFGGLDLSRIKVEGKEYDVIAQLARESRLRPADLDRIFVRNTAGSLVQLSSLVTRSEGGSQRDQPLRTPPLREHHGIARCRAHRYGGPAGRGAPRRELPVGFLYAWEGDARSLADATTEIWWVLGLAGIIVFMTLAAQFESLIHPWTVMLSLPLAFVGAFGALWLLNFLGRLGVIPRFPQ